MRVKRLGVSIDLLKCLLDTGGVIQAAKVISGLPKDAVVCGVSLFSMTIWLEIASDTFDEVKEGQEIPMLEVTFEQIRSVMS